MDEKQLESLARDINDLKRSVKRNSPIMHDIFDMKGWDLFSLTLGVLVSAFALGAHILSSVYGSFDHIPLAWQASLWAVLAVVATGSAVIKLLLFTRRRASGGGYGLGRIMGSFLGGYAKHIHLPFLASLIILLSLAITGGRPWMALPASAILLGLWCNVIVMQIDMKSLLPLGYWSLLTGILGLWWAESAPFLWIFIIFGGMFFVFAGAIRLGRRP